MIERISFPIWNSFQIHVKPYFSILVFVHLNHYTVQNQLPRSSCVRFSLNVDTREWNLLFSRNLIKQNTISA